MKRDRLLAWVFLTPAVILVGVLMYYPMVGTAIESFYSTSFINPNPEFVGLALYERIFASGEFGTIVWNSCVWTVFVVLLQNLLGFATALLLDQRLPLSGVMRSLILLPWILPGVVAAILWRFMYDPQLGLINSFLIRIGVADQGAAWLADSSTAMAAAIAAAVWKGFPFSTVVYLAALQNVDKEQVEAAIIDGAGRIGRLFHVVIPSMREVIVINLVLTTILTFNYFDMIWVLTRGGPQNATHIFPTKIYELGFGQFRFGEAATYGVFSILVLAILITLYFLVQRFRPRTGEPGMTGQTALDRAFIALAQIALAAVILLPFFWMVSVSLKPGDEPFAIPARLWPENPTLDNYVTAFRPEFRIYFLNSVVVSLSTVVITVSLALLAAYTFTRSQARAILVLMSLVVAAQMFPASAIIIPIYKLMKEANLLNTYASLILAYVTITLPVAIWMLRGFLARLPRELDEAAAVDGAGPFRTFFSIIVPLSRPGLVATSVFVLIVTWQEFLFALSFTSTKDMRTLPVGMNDFIGQYGIRYGELMASSVLISLPVVAVFFLLQRQFVAGLTAGAVKG